MDSRALRGLADRVDAARAEVEEVEQILRDEVGSDLSFDATQAANILRDLAEQVRDLDIGGTGPIRLRETTPAARGQTGGLRRV